MSEQPRSTILSCLGGRPIPPEAYDGWNRLTRFSDGALGRFWEVMEPVLADRPEARERALAFARTHSLRPEDMQAAIDSCSYLVRHAASLDLDSETFGEDLRRLSGPFPLAAENVTKGYAQMKGALREALFERALVTHGAVLVGLDWRVDTIRASSTAAKLDYEVVLLTMHVRRGDTIEQMHVQLPPSALSMIRELAGTFGE